MSITNKGAKWERGNSLCFIFSVIPLFNYIPFLYMNSMVKNKKWSLIGWGGFLAYFLLICTMLFGNMVGNPYTYPIYSDIKRIPVEKQYMNDEQYKKYNLDYNYINSYEYQSSDEHAKYEADYEEWMDEASEWENTPENKAQLEKYMSFANIQKIVSIVATLGIPFVYLSFLILAFLQRPDYLRKLAAQENSGQFISRVSQDIMQNEEQPQNEILHKEAVHNEATHNDAQGFVVDINVADEEQIASLPGVTIIDAKKAVAYRKEKGSFHSKNEFFDLIHAKPHVIAHAEGLIKVVEVKNSDSSGDVGRKRRIDL